MNEIVIYQTADNQNQVEVKFDGDTVWLNQYQLAELFGGSRSNIAEHIKHIYDTHELDKVSTRRKFRQVRKEGRRTVERDIDHFNLDIIIAVGYRVNSKRGTQFRQWANQRLKDYLVRGYAINQKRLEELQQAVRLISKSGETEALQLQQAKGLLEIIGNYANSFVLLNRFDSNNLTTENLTGSIPYEIEYNEAITAIAALKEQLIRQKEASPLFGKEKDKSFVGILKAVTQTFGGEYLYASIEEQAAHLLYFIIKNHPFADGNKRIGAFIFIWFLEKNRRVENK